MYQLVKKEEGKILAGRDIFVGSEEKARNHDIIHIDFSGTYGNYRMFSAGSHEKLLKVCEGIEAIQNDASLSTVKKFRIYQLLIKYLHICHHVSTSERNSKLDGINSLSTSVMDNLFCAEHLKNPEYICCHCYANAQQHYQNGVAERSIINGVILRNVIIPVSAWKKFINPADVLKFFRFEAFGDVQNKTQAINYINFCKAFPRTRFAVWTKNPGIFHFVLLEVDKPKNLSIIVSSFRLNKQDLFFAENHKWIDHIFTVYEKKFAKKNNIPINCGGHKCMECIKKHKACYFRNSEQTINELLK